MKKMLHQASTLLGSSQDHLRNTLPGLNPGMQFYGNSIHKIEDLVIALARDKQHRFLMVLAESKSGLMRKFSGQEFGENGACAMLCPLNAENAAVLREIFPWTAPVSLRHKQTTLGCGDRLGLATPGHLAAAKAYRVSPVLAQQSIRELTLTGRSYREVVDDTTFLVYQSGFTDGYGADGDHLKSIADIDVALAAGMPMITLDLSEVMQAAAADWSDAELNQAFSRLPEAEKARIHSSYFDKEFQLGYLNLQLDAATAKRCAVMYLEALDFAGEVDAHLRRHRGDAYDLEISIDETTAPTLPAHHFFIARELEYRKVSVNSLAPRFIGEFQKGIDYIGDLDEFTRQFAEHCEIARACGNYKISVHSGSDKFSAFPAVGRHTDMRFHLKTAGTSWLEAVRVIAVKDAVLYRVLHQCALDHFGEAQKLYHVTTDLNKIPDLGTLYDEDLPGLLDQNEARQLLHITYGSILNDPAIHPLFFAALHKHEECYHEFLCLHFEKHLHALGVPERV